MKLYEAPRNTKVRLKSTESGPPASINPKVGETYYFKGIDGMYGRCLDSEKRYVYLKAWAEVEIVEELK